MKRVDIEKTEKTDKNEILEKSEKESISESESLDMDKLTDDRSSEINNNSVNDENLETIELPNSIINKNDNIRDFTEKQILNPDRISKPILTKYEIAKIIGIRANQIANGSKIMITGVQNLDPVKIARLELKYKKTPFLIKRPLPNNYYEIWKIDELEYI